MTTPFTTERKKQQTTKIRKEQRRQWKRKRQPRHADKRSQRETPKRYLWLHEKPVGERNLCFYEKPWPQVGWWDHEEWTDDWNHEWSDEDDYVDYGHQWGMGDDWWEDWDDLYT